MSIQLYICGARGTYPAFGNNFKEYGKDTSCYVIKENDYAIVLDCGSGFYNAREILKDCTKVDVLLSHVHYDHVIGFYENFDITTQEKFTYYGEFMEWEQLENRYKAIFPLREYLNENIVSVSMNEEVDLNDDYKVIFTRANHPDNSSMIKIIKNGYTICYTGDNEYDHSKRVVDWARGADVMLFEGTYSREESNSLKGRGHSCWEDGIEVARKAGVKVLFIIHHDLYHTDKFLANEEKKARKLSDTVYFARQGQVWTLR